MQEKGIPQLEEALWKYNSTLRACILILTVFEPPILVDDLSFTLIMNNVFTLEVPLFCLFGKAVHSNHFIIY